MATARRTPRSKEKVGESLYGHALVVRSHGRGPTLPDASRTARPPLRESQLYQCTGADSEPDHVAGSSFAQSRAYLTWEPESPGDNNVSQPTRRERVDAKTTDLSDQCNTKPFGLEEVVDKLLQFFRSELRILAMRIHKSYHHLTTV